MGGISSSLLYSLKIMTMFLPAAAGRAHTSALSTRPRALEVQHLTWLEAGQYCTGHQQRTPTASPQTAVWRNIIQTSFAYMTCYSADKRTHLHMKSNLTTNNNIEARTYLVMFNKQIHSQALKKFFNPNVNKFVQSNTNRGTVLGIILLISENNYQNKQSHGFSR